METRILASGKHDEHEHDAHEHGDEFAEAREAEEQSGAELHNEADRLKIRSLKQHPLLQRSLLRPYVFTHVESMEGAQRMMPFYWLTTRLDPNFVRAYTSGAFWLAFKFSRVDEAEQYLDAGLRANPRSYEIYSMKGHLAYSLRNNWDQAIQYYELAMRLNPRSTEEELLDYLESLRYLGRSYNKSGQYEKALEAGYMGWRIRLDAPGFASIISDATTALLEDATSRSAQLQRPPL